MLKLQQIILQILRKILFVEFLLEFRDTFALDMSDDCILAEDLVRQTIKEKSEEFRKTNRPLDKTCLKAIGFSEKGAERFSNFMDSNRTHFSSLSWINLFLDKLFGPEGDSSDSSFPFSGTITNTPFDKKYKHMSGGENKNLIIINFTEPDKMKIWKENETEEAIKRKKDKGKMVKFFLLVFPITFFCSSYQCFSFLTPLIKNLELFC